MHGTHRQASARDHFNYHTRNPSGDSYVLQQIVIAVHLNW